ncbi:hypothetical protein ACFQRL_04665 [Microbacterium fluvii]|uniref:HhH-GPD domain-containing protein n=1 Tax=Microbacterium fluvii TaxID=415215 RepID=A0ABW2HCP7_9MICO|nr:hypothetical protein [Microbacterium fluvii]MCU4671884.1 hypothetical protein [Microbacterium fluvii]
MSTVPMELTTAPLVESGVDRLPPDGYLSTLIAGMRTDVVLRPDNYRARTIEWGQPWMYESPAYWVARAEQMTPTSSPDDTYRLGSSLDEEVVACLLGGFGVTYELNVAAFHAVRDAGLIASDVAPDPGLIAEQLARPLSLASGRAARYRFPNQKSARIASALSRLKQEPAPDDPIGARDWLLSFNGIGPKTASWIVRNRWPDAEVAIVDIHVWRAATACGVFDPDWNPTRNYWEMEAVFVEWARHGGVSAAALDATIWAERAARARRRLGAVDSR